MKPAAFISNDDSLNVEEVMAFEGKRFALPKAMEILERFGIECRPILDPLGIDKLFSFGHKEIHLFGIDCCGGQGIRVCFDSQIFLTTKEQAEYAPALLNKCIDLIGKGASITAHGHGMFQSMAKKLMEKQQEKILTAVYDMQVCPPTYEFFSFLSQAEKHRVQNGYTALDVVFFPGPMHGFRDDGLPPNPNERAGMLHRICVGGARLLRSVRNVHVMKERSHLAGDVFPTNWTNDLPRFLYGPEYQKNAYKCLTATQSAHDEIGSRFDPQQRFATITLRQANYWVSRNSNVLAWEKAARWLTERGITPVCIPDTHGDEMRDADNFQAAAWDIDLRMALYEHSVVNLGVSNGPMTLNFYSDACKYIWFQIPDEDSPGNQVEFLKAQNIHVGDNYTKNGVTLWERDDPANVIAALESWFEQKVAA